VALGVLGCSFVPLERLIFFPDRHVPAPPAGVEERWITTADAVRLHAWYAGVPGATATLVWAHGNAGNIGVRADVLQALAAQGLNVLAFDYRGYGRSEGRPTEAGVYLDAEAAYDSERARGVPATQVIAFGESLGTAVAIRLAERRPCAGLALVSPFTRISDVARHHYGPLGMLAGNRFDSLARVPGLTVPVFVAHGDADEVVPFALGERLFAAVRAPKEFFRAVGAHHNDVFSSPGVVQAIAAFARKTTGGG
jgi:fermentation-respiration switch protein FrsA (DUF1100 family)